MSQIKVTRDSIVHAGQHDDRLYVITNAEYDKHGRALCVTRWDYSGSRWECSYEYVGNDWSGIDSNIVSEVDDKYFTIRFVISEY